MDAPPLAEALVSAMRMYFGHDRCADRCKPLVDVLDEFCALRECLRPLSAELLRGLLREQLRNLHDSAWTRQMEGGQALLRAVNLSCVMLLNNINRAVATTLLLELGTEESEVIASSLVVKCLRKITKGLAPGKAHPAARGQDQETEVSAVLDAAGRWLRTQQPRLSQLPAASGGAFAGGRSLIDTAVCALLDGVREAFDAAQLACPEIAAAWAQRLSLEEQRLLQGSRVPVGTVGAAIDKENLPTGDIVFAKSDVKGLASPLSASGRPTAHFGSVGTTQNAGPER